MLGEIEYITMADTGAKGASDKAVVAMCEQGSSEWLGLRIGIPTASNADMIVTSKGKPVTSQTRNTFINGLVAERLLGMTEMHYDNPAMERGRNLEPRARAWYEFQTGRTVKQVGFVFGDEARNYGASPDGICEDRLVEIKCPMHKTMIGNLIAGKVPTGYVSQVQMQLYVTGMSCCDFVIYTPEPEIPSVIWTVEADPVLQAAFAVHIPQFVSEVENRVALIKERYTNE